MILASTYVIDPFDGPEIAQLSVAIVALVATVAAAWLANRGRLHAKEARDQVQNDHKTNLRDELDKRHAESMFKWQSTADDVRTIRNEVKLLRAGWETNRADIDDLMDTDQRRRLNETQWKPPVPGGRRERRLHHV